MFRDRYQQARAKDMGMFLRADVRVRSSERLEEESKELEYRRRCHATKSPEMDNFPTRNIPGGFFRSWTNNSEYILGKEQDGVTSFVRGILDSLAGVIMRVADWRYAGQFVEALESRRVAVPRELHV